MLKFVIGRSGYGKTEYCYNKIKELIDAGENNIIFITPEQFNFTAEKHLLELIGQEKISCVKNSSFSILSRELKELYGGNNLTQLSNGASLVLLRKALLIVKDKLFLLNNNINNFSFLSSLLLLKNEFESCGISTDYIKSLSQTIKDKQLSNKLHDLYLIFEQYNEYIEGKYCDSQDEEISLYTKLLENDYLNDKIIIIDGFNGFVNFEYQIIDVMIKKSKDVYITLCSDFNNDNYIEKINDKYSMFAYVNRTASMIIKGLDENQLSFSIESLSKNFRAKNNDIKALEKGIFDALSDTSNNDGNIIVYSADSLTDECNYVSVNILNYLKQGVKASDIAVICRDNNLYSGEMISSFKKYNIPYFDDELQDIKNQPLVVFITYLLRIFLYSFNIEDVLGLTKTGLTSLNEDDINALENYAYLWKISGYGKWNKEFISNPNGFVNKNFEIKKADEILLNNLNENRLYLMTKLNKFKSNVKGSSVKEICKNIYELLIAFSVDKRLKELALDLSVYGKNTLSEEQQRVWDLVINILEELSEVIGDEIISIKDFASIFSIMISSYELGTVPTGLDNVVFGQADRIRLDNPKIVFVVGLNDGEFPKTVSNSGLLNEKDRIILSDNQINLFSYGKLLNDQEKYFAYSAATVASDKLHLSYRLSGESQQPSVIISETTNLINDLQICTNDDFDQDYFIGSEITAIENLAKYFENNNPTTNALKELFKNDGRYKTLENIYNNNDIVINNKNNSVKLFGEDMKLSASKIEEFYGCRFKYFCKNGLNAKEFNDTELSPRLFGTIVHEVLEKLIKNVGSNNLHTLSDSELLSKIKNILDTYFKENIEGTDYTIKFYKQFNRLSKMLLIIVKNVADEFSQSNFEAKKFEFKIRIPGTEDDGDSIESQTIQLENGSISIRGYVDRMDVLEKNGNKYIRVVDYKTGSKEFNLNDVINGLNLQMFLYLFTICNDPQYKNSIPAGVLYKHSSKSIASFEKGYDKETVQKSIDSSMKSVGLVLNDEVHSIVEDMDTNIVGESRFIPVKKKDDKLSGNLATYEQLGLIEKEINSLLVEMGESLHCGFINPNPKISSNKKSPCDYCPYIEICNLRKEIENTSVTKYKDDKIYDILRNEFN